MTTTAKLDSARVELSPGTEAVVPLHIRNTGELVEGYQIEVLGSPAAWTTVEPAVIEGLYPGTTTTATVRFAPPRSSAVAAGRLDFGIRIVPFDHADAKSGQIIVARLVQVRHDRRLAAHQGHVAGDAAFADAGNDLLQQ